MRDLHDVATLINADHRLVETLFQRLEAGQGDRRTLVNQVIFNLAIHAGAEEQRIYPAMKKAFDDDGDSVDEALDEHQSMKDALVVLDRGEPGEAEFEDALRTLMAEVRHHIPEEEGNHLPRLRQAVGDERMAELGKDFLKAELHAPTRPHPHSSSNPVVAAPAALVDKLRDKRSDRDESAAIDASGLLDPQAQALVEAHASLGVKPMHLLDASQARKQPTAADAVKRMLKGQDRDNSPEPVDSVLPLTIPSPAGDIEARVYRPQGADGTALPVLVYFHGGGWVIADLDVYDASCRGLANRAGCLVVSVEYRQAPEHPFPAAHDDALVATRWVMAHAGDLGGEPRLVAVAGESAGGNLAAATCLALKQAGEALPVFQLLIYPVASGAMDTPSYQEAQDAKPLYSGLMHWFFAQSVTDPAQLSDPRISLVEASVEDLTGLPPALVITAERDPLRDEGEQLAKALLAAGVPVAATRYPGVMHEFFGAAAVMDKAAKAQEEAASALRAVYAQTVAGMGVRN
jgi:acetyl esterase/lipase